MLPTAPCLSALSVHIHSALCASPAPAPESARFLSEQKCFSSVCDFKSFGMVYGLWGEPAAGKRCGRRLASSLLLSGLNDSSKYMSFST